MRILLPALVLLLLSAQAFGVAYVGGSYGLNYFTSKELDDHKVSPKGTMWGGFFGVGKDFLGLEGFYTSLNASSKLKHQGASYDVNTNAKAFGAAMRVSFEVLSLRLGVARYSLDQSIDMPAGSSHTAADKIYNIQDGTSKNGFLFGVGLHKRLGPGRVFVDYSRYQITDVGHYDTVSVGYSFALPDSWLPTLRGPKDD